MIRVLVVEDDHRTAEAHGQYVTRVDGFELAGVVHTAGDAVRALREAQGTGQEVHLLLLDMNLPDHHGLVLCRRLRAAGLVVDVVAVTAARELDVVRGAVAVGVVQYLIKPFTFGLFTEKLAAYRTYFEQLRSPVSRLSQREVDTAFAALRTSNAAGLPKGLSRDTLDSVSELLARQPGPLSASEVADELRLARITARRYLEYLADRGVVTRAPRYGSRGRPELEYARQRQA